MADKTVKDYTLKYQGQNPLEKLRDGEPYFFIRSQDKLASEAVSAYAELLKREADKAFLSGDEALSMNLYKQSLGVQRVAQRILDWQANNLSCVKLPD